MGDGWLADLDPNALDKAKASFDQLYGYVEEVGRKREDVGINIVGADITKRGLDYERLARNWRDLGVTHMDVGTIGAGFYHRPAASRPDTGVSKMRWGEGHARYVPWLRRIEPQGLILRRLLEKLTESEDPEAEVEELLAAILTDEKIALSEEERQRLHETPVEYCLSVTRPRAAGQQRM